MTDYDTSRQRVSYYIDGFNLYHGCFANETTRLSWRAYRWLDIEAMCQRMYPSTSLVKVRYFTAWVEPRPNNTETAKRQQMYLRAVNTLPDVEIHMGRFSTWAKTRVVADPNSKHVIPLVPETTAYVIESREKGSDVNLASYLLLDAFQDRYDLAVVISNDSDLATPIRMVRDQLDKQVAIVNPRKRLAFDLKGIADSYRSIRRTWLENAQLPEILQDEVGEIRKPEEWR